MVGPEKGCAEEMFAGKINSLKSIVEIFTRCYVCLLGVRAKFLKFSWFTEPLVSRSIFHSSPRPREKKIT